MDRPKSPGSGFRKHTPSQMTSRLYYRDAYLTAFEGSITEIADGGRRVYLDRSAFYPTSGGQPFDLGTLGSTPVSDVIDEDERIAHVLAAPLAAHGIGDVVEGAIDWPRRFDHMQQHSGQHLLTAVFVELFGYDTVSVHFGSDRSSLDLDVGAVSSVQLLEAERRANEIVWENRPVTVTFEDSATAAGLRKPPPRSGTIRVVSIDRLDRSACGGTHVRATGEIGAIALRGTERMRKQTRVEFLCGGRVVRQSRNDHEALSRIALALKASMAEAPALVLAQGEQLRDAVTTIKRLESELAAYEARALYDATPPGRTGVRVAVVRRETGTLDGMRPLAQAFVALPHSVLIATVASPATVLVAASDDSGLDAGAELKGQLQAAGGRGGGSARMAQGTVPNAELLDGIIDGVRSALT